MKKYLPVLKKSPLFAGIGEENLLAMLACLSATIKEYPKDSYIFHCKDVVTSVGIVLSGSVHIIKEDFWGNLLLISQLGEGQLFGEAFSCAQAPELPVSVITVTPVKVLFINYKKIITTCSSACTFHSRLIQNILKSVAAKNLALTQKMEHMSRKTTREKLLSYLSEQSLHASSNSFTIPFNRQQLADYLCVDRSAMSAELCRMRDENLLQFHKNSFTLL